MNIAGWFGPISNIEDREFWCPLTKVAIAPFATHMNFGEQVQVIERDLTALIDTGAQRNCISSSLADRLKLPKGKPTTINHVGVDAPCATYLATMWFEASGVAFAGDFLGMPPNQRFDLIIGAQFLNRCKIKMNNRLGSVSIDYRGN